MDKNLNIFQNSEVDLNINGGPTNINAMLGSYDCVILKPNKKGSYNVLEQWMVSTPHTKYVVKYNFNLQDTIIEMPEDCIIEIDCGSLQHGTLVGHDTVLLNTNNVDNALVDITLDGTWVSGKAAADEEDITEEKGLLKFANKAYEPNKFSGLGRVYLRKNINPAPVAEDIWMFRKGADDIVYLMYRYQGVVYHIYDEDTGKGVILENNLVKESDTYNISMLPAAAQEHNMPYVKEGDRIIITLPNGGRINDVQLNQTEMYYYTDVEPGGEGNILTQDMINKPNTIYIIQYDYSLNGETITIPNNCILEFNGGSLSNGTLVGNETNIISDSYTIFPSNINISGTWIVQKIYSNWFGDIEESNKLQELLHFTNDDIPQTVEISEGNYSVESYVSGYTPILPASNTNIIFNGHIYINSGNDNGGIAIRLNGKDNVTISGYGTITGDRDQVTIVGEWAPAIYVAGGNNITIENITIEDSFGDGIYFNYVCNNVVVRGVTVDNIRRNGICLSAGNGYVFENNAFKKTNGTNPQAGLELETDGGYGILENVTIINNYFEDNVTGVAIGANNQNMRDILIANNTIKSEMNGAGISFYENYDFTLSNIIIRNNYIETKHIGISFGKHDKAIIENNVIKGENFSFKSNNTEYYTSNIIIRNNEINGLLDIKAHGVTLDNNRIVGVMQFNASELFKVTNNRIETEGNSAFRGKNSEFSNNTIIATGLPSSSPLYLIFIGLGSRYPDDYVSNIKIENNYIDQGDYTALYGFYLNLKGGTFVGNNASNFARLFFLREDYDDNVVNGCNVKGSFEDRPTNYTSFYKGATYYDTTNNRMLYYNGTAWADSEGIGLAIKTIGNINQRPDIDTINFGFRYWDTTLNQFITWNGFKWIGNNGFIAVPNRGSSADRPNAMITNRTLARSSYQAENVYVGFTTKDPTDQKYYVIDAISGTTITWKEESTIKSDVPADAPRSGYNSQRPSAEYCYNNLYVGYDYYYTSNAWPYYIASMTRTGSGTTESPYVYNVIWKPRVVNLLSINDIGFEYFDKTKGLPIYATAISAGVITWVKADGTNPDL